jgi:hypothetical protein
MCVLQLIKNAPRGGGKCRESVQTLHLPPPAGPYCEVALKAIVVDGRRRHHLNPILLTSNPSKTAVGVKHFSRIMFHSHCCFRGVGGQRDIT